MSSRAYYLSTFSILLLVILVVHDVSSFASPSVLPSTKTPDSVLIARNCRPRFAPLGISIPSFDDRFEKWRFLQDVLDGDVDDATLGSLLLQVLENFLKASDAKRPTEDDNASGSPLLTPDLRDKIHVVINEFTVDPAAPLEQQSDGTSLTSLEDLLPDPEEEEEAHKSNWDVVMEIHGRELVKTNETNPTFEWRKLSVVTRLLIHFDFLMVK